jgi:tetratricopeptide (TPR) repeat protein
MSQEHHDHGGCPHCWQEEWKKLGALEGFERALSLMKLARYAWRANQWAHSMRLAEEALEIFSIDPMRLVEQAESYVAIAINARELGRHGEAYAFLDRGLELFRNADDKTGVVWENKRCWWKFEDKDYEAALGYCRLTLEQNRANADTEAVVYDLLMVGACLYELGRFDEELEVQREARQLAKENEQYEYVAMADHNIGEALLAMGSPIEAQGYVEQALEVFRIYEKNRRIGEGLFLLGKTFAARYMWDDALKNCREALTLMQSQNPPRYKDILDIETVMADVYGATGREKEANEVMARLERFAALFNDESETIAS